MSAVALAAAVIAASATWLLVSRPAVVRAPATGRRSWRVLLALVPVALLTLAALGPRALALFGVAAVAAAGIADLVRRDRARGAASELRRSTVEMGEALAGEVRAGRAPADALARVAEQYPLLREPAETARLGGDVPGALRVLSQTPGADSLLPVAASWQLSTEAGASLAEALARSADQARADLGLATLVSGELASARATARLLAALPFLLLALGRGLGFDPWGFLLRSWPGIGCLTLGVLLALAGLRWVDQLGDQGAGP